MHLHAYIATARHGENNYSRLVTVASYIYIANYAEAPGRRVFLMNIINNKNQFVNTINVSHHPSFHSVLFHQAALNIPHAPSVDLYELL